MRSPKTFMIRPNTLRPTGTEIGAPVSTACIPRTKPSVDAMAMHRTVSLPKCWAASSVKWILMSSDSKSMRIALFRSGSCPGGNCTSTTGPMTCTTRPTRFWLSLMARASFIPTSAHAAALDSRGGGAPAPAGVPSNGADVEGLGPAHDLRDLLGDGRLARPVEGQRQGPDHLRGVVGRGPHGPHAGRVFAGLGLQQRPVHLHTHVPRQEQAQHFRRGWLVDVLHRLLDAVVGRLS